MLGATAAAVVRADRSLGRLDGLASVLPNPDLFVAMHRQSGIDRAKRNMGKVTDELLTLIRKQV